MRKYKITVLLLITLFAFTLLTIGTSSDPIERLKDHKESVEEVLNLIKQGNEEDALTLLDSLHAAVITARANLRGWSFLGEEGERLTDPFALPVGTYRVHFTTEGFGAVNIVSLDKNGSTLLFNVFEGRASEGASTIYRSDGKRIMVQFSNISAPYELVFEKLE